MSFEVICQGCGAVSGPSVGICPFCKAVLISTDDKNFEQINSVAKIYESGRLDLALNLAKKHYQTDAEAKKDISFLILYVKILMDTESPTSLIKSILAEAHLLSPSDQDILDYMELIEAKGYLKPGLNDRGEIQLKNLLRRSPKNIHANFLYGAHLIWTEEQTQLAIPYLETCVRLSPKFLRAWACLGAIYKKMGNLQLAANAFQKCVELETDSKMRDYFLQEIKSLK
jgi:tetratricopeptide (TPR) repeat protein